MQFTTIAAAFFLGRSPGTPNLDDLVRVAGVRGAAQFDETNRRALGFREPDRQVLGGTWGPFGPVWAVLDELDGLVCLQLYASMNDYLETQRAAESHPGSADRLLEYVSTFRDACIAIKPMAGFLDLRAHYGDEQWDNKQGNRNWVRSYAPIVAAMDANAMADERFSLLYLDDSLARLWDAEPIRDDRDAVQVPEGRLVFARRGPARLA